MLPPQKIAEDRVVGQRCRRRPDTNTAIEEGVLTHFRGGAEERQCSGNERSQDDEDQGSD